MANPGEAADVRKILVVDDEKLSLEMVTELLQGSFPQVQLLNAGDGIEALEILDRHEVDLVVTDLLMPRLDGLGLLSHISGRGLDLPIVVMTAFGRSDIEQSVRNLGGIFYLEKPIDLDLLVVTVEQLLAADRSQQTSLSLKEFARFVANQHKTGALEVRSLDQSGCLYFANGLLVEATTPFESGEAAALDILSWEQVTLHFAARHEGPPPAIEKNLSELYAAVAKRKDQSTQPVQLWSRGTVMNWDLDETSEKKELPMADVKESLNAAMAIDGAIGVALVDYTSGMCLGMAGGSPQLNMEVAAAGNTAVVRAKMKVMKDLGLKDAIEDILITLGRQYHLIRPLRRSPNLFLYLATDRDRSNLALSRHKLNEIEDNLNV
jgi:CheY-like chemotaxis protein